MNDGWRCPLCGSVPCDIRDAADKIEHLRALLGQTLAQWKSCESQLNPADWYQYGTGQLMQEVITELEEENVKDGAK